MSVADRAAAQPAGAAYVAPAVDPDADRRAIARLWVANGALWFVAAWYCWIAWIVSGDFRTNTIGRSDDPAWYENLMRGWEVFAFSVTGLILWFVVIRPRLRHGRMTFDGLFFLGCAMMFFQEPWINWTSLQFLYSSTSINFGGWMGHIPGWSSPNPELVPVSAWAGTAYLWLVAVPAYGGSRFMGRLRRRNPAMGRWTMIGWTYLAFCVFDLVLESFITRTQLFNYGSVIPSLSLWAGTDHQFPLYETVSWAGTYTVLTCLHFFRDDRGRSLPERGVDRLGIRHGGLETFARYLAIMGVCQLAILFTYNIPYQLYAQHAVMPKVFVEREWRTAGVCGPKTAYDCPSRRVPIATRDSPTNRVVEPVRP